MNEQLQCLPRTIEQQICDLQFQLNQLRQEVEAGTSAQPLTCSEVIESAELPTAYSTNLYSITLDKFNRVPRVGDNFTTLWNYTGANAAGYIVQWTVLTVTAEAAFCNSTGYSSIQGPGIAAIENDGYSQGEGFTISHIKQTLTNGEEEYFDVQAENGAAQFITLTAPETATTGTLTEEQLNLLKSDYNNNYIILNSEKYIPMDLNQTLESGWIMYTHIGRGTEVNAVPNIKTLYVLINAGTWTLQSDPQKNMYLHTLIFAPTIAPSAQCYITIINSKSNSYKSLSEVTADMNVTIAKFFGVMTGAGYISVGGTDYLPTNGFSILVATAVEVLIIYCIQKSNNQLTQLQTGIQNLRDVVKVL